MFTRLKNTSARAALLGSASALFMATPALANDIVFAAHLTSAGEPAGIGAVASGQFYSGSSATVQIRTDNGAFVSIVGDVAFTVGTDNVLQITSGSVTVSGASAGARLKLRGADVAMAGPGAAATFNVGSGGIDGRAIAGTLAVADVRGSAAFRLGEAFAVAAKGGAPHLILAANAQAVPGQTTANAAADIVPHKTSATVMAMAPQAQTASQSSVAVPQKILAVTALTKPPANTGAGALAAAGATLVGYYSEAQNVTYGAADPAGGGDIMFFPTYKAVLNKAGGLETLLYSMFSASEGRGTQKNVEVYANGGVAIGRWTDGTGTNVHGAFPQFETPLKDNVLSANQGVHYAMTLPVAVLPLVGGRADYKLAAATRPTYFHDGSIAPGTFSNGLLSVVFGAQASLSFKGTVTFKGPSGDQIYNLTTFGTMGDPTSNILGHVNKDGSFASALHVSSTGTGAICNTSSVCDNDSSLSGGLAADLSGAALVYSINRQIYGSAAFYLSGAKNLNTTVPKGITSGSSAKSGLTNGAHALLFNGQFSGNGVALSGVYPNAPQTYDATGALSAVGGDIIVRTSASVAEQASGAGWEIGRWNGGAAGGKLLGTALYLKTQGLHYVSMALPTGAPADGLYSYKLAAATRPTYSNGRVTSTSLFKGELSILLDTTSFSASKFGLKGSITTVDKLGTDVYTFSSRGGTGFPVGLATTPLFGSKNYVTATSSLIGGALTVTGHDCQAGSLCVMSVSLQTGGDALGLAGITYTIQDMAAIHSDLSLYPALTGAALFTKTGSGPAPTYPVKTSGSPHTGQIFATVLQQTASATFNRTVGTGYTVKSSTKGAISSYNDGQYLDIARNTATAANAGTSTVAGSGRISWSRWTGGSSVNNYSPGKVYDTITPNQGRHMIAGDPASDIPTAGSAVFTLAGATAPTIADGSQAPGTLTGTMGVSFAARTVGFNLIATVGGFGYVIKSPGGSTSTANSGIHFGTDGRFATGGLAGTPGPNGSIVVKGGGAACPAGGGTCYADISGFLSGVGAKQAGIVYNIQSGTAGASNQAITGAAGFTWH